MKKSIGIISVVLCVLMAIPVLSFGAAAKAPKKYVKSISIKKKATITIPEKEIEGNINFRESPKLYFGDKFSPFSTMLSDISDYRFFKWRLYAYFIKYCQFINLSYKVFVDNIQKKVYNINVTYF